MPGTKIGGLKAAKTNKERHGDDFYTNIGRKGGTANYKGLRGFAANRDLASKVGRIGGMKSRRSKALVKVKEGK
jgi:general stress protein YciG